MKVEQVSNKSELNIREVARVLNLDADELIRQGHLKQVLETGVSKAMIVRFPLGQVDGRSVEVSTTARLALGRDREGNRQINVVMKKDKPTLDRYLGMDLNADQQEQLRKGKTIVVKDNSDREHLVKFDQELNKVAGMKKSTLLAPEQVGTSSTGYTKLDNQQKAAIKQGQAVQVELRGKAFTVEVDPIERKLNITPTTPKLAQQVGGDAQPIRRRKTGPTI